MTNITVLVEDAPAELEPASNETELPRWPTPEAKQFITVDSKGESVSMMKVGGKTYPMKNQPQCYTCRSDYRYDIEDALLKAVTPRKISESLEGRPRESGLPHFPSRRNIQAHKDNGHMPIHAEIWRTIIEIRAKELGLSLENFHASLADYITLGRLVIQRTIELMADGVISPDLKDALGFAKLIQQYEVQAGEGVDQEVVYQAFLVFDKIIRENTEPEQETAIREALATNPVLRALRERQDQADEIMVDDVEDQAVPV